MSVKNIHVFSHALKVLVSPGGWIDKTLAIGSTGVLELAKKGFVTSQLLSLIKECFKLSVIHAMSQRWHGNYFVS